MLQKNHKTSQDKPKRVETLTASARLVTVAKHPANVGTHITVPKRKFLSIDFCGISDQMIPQIFIVLTGIVLVYPLSTTNTQASNVTFPIIETTEKEMTASLHVAGQLSWTNSLWGLMMLAHIRFHLMHLSA